MTKADPPSNPAQPGHPSGTRPLSRRWLWGGAACALLALGLALWHLPHAAPLVATLGTPDSALQFDVRHDGSTLILSRESGPPAATDFAHVAWLIVPGAAPVLLGEVQGDDLRVPYPAAPPGWRLSISLEPAGAIPSDGPSGPIVASGTITAN